MRRSLKAALSAVIVVAPLALVASQSGSSVAAPTHKQPPPSNPTTKIAGLQHWCGSSGITCAEPSRNWDEFAGYKKAVRAGAHILPYIGHDEPAQLFYSNRPGAGNNVTWQLTLPKDPPTLPRQDGSGGTFGFQLHPTFWFGMVMCDPNGSPNVGGIPGHPAIPCKPDSDSNIFASTNPHSPRYFGLGPGQAFEELQFYPPGWAPWPTGIGCTARQWCAALNIDTFQDNENTGQFNNNACLSGAAGPEPVNFAFLTKNGKSTAPGSPLHPEHFIPNNAKNFLMNSGDRLTVHLFDTPSGLRTTVVDNTTGTNGLMTASAANGFATVNWNPNGKKCTATPLNFHPEFSTSSPLTRNVNAAHTYNISFSDEIGHFEYCGKVGTDPLSTCLKPLGSDTNDGDTAAPFAGDDVLCLPAKASLRVKIGGCVTAPDGDFDGVSYTFGWPGSISNPTADRLLHPTSQLFSSPTTGGKNYTSMTFEADIPRTESDDSAFRVDTPCQRHFANPADPHPGLGCVNPPPNSNFYPFYSTRQTASGCRWQEGGRYIPGTTNLFGGNSKAEFGPLRVINYPTAPFGTITKRSNDFRSKTISVPCRAR